MLIQSILSGLQVHGILVEMFRAVLQITQPLIYSI